jgi:23S rRNA pseudouridine1911/1915/1917 synthase
LRIQYFVTESDQGQRAVDVLRKNTGMSRMMSKKVRLYGSLLCNGEHCRMVDKVNAGDILVAEYWPHGRSSGDLKNDPKLPVIYKDDWLVIVNKPAGMVTHPTYLHDRGSVTDRLADHPLHPIIRLDRDTSGVLPVALNGHAHHVITKMKMEKTYVALVYGKMPEKSGIFDQPIGRHPTSIMLRLISDEGKSAKTIWRLCYYFKASDVSFIQLKLVTGRTHQIRVHCQAAGHPLLGDGLYGICADLSEHNPPTAFNHDERISLERLFSRQALHAASLKFTHPQSLQEKTVNAKLPNDFIAALKYLWEKENTVSN